MAFQLGPGRDNNVLDFTESSACKVYYKAITPLERLYDGKPESIAVFLASVTDRSRRFGWSTLLTVPDATATDRNLITEYGLVTMAEVRAKALTYSGQQTREAQNSDMLYHFLMESLAVTFKAEVLLYSNDYTINGVPDGILLLKQIIVLSYIDTRATTAHIRDTLVDMPKTLLSLNGNITAFNKWVREQVGKLTARGATAPDLLAYLWKTYKQAPDKEFVSYIKDLRNQYDDGRSDYTSEDLMVLAENKYKAIVQNEEWGQPSEEQAEIVALTSKIDVLEKQISTAKSSNQTKVKPTGKTTQKKGDKPQTKGSNKPKSTKSKVAWKLIPPKGFETKVDGFPTKQMNNQTYFWCPNHEDGKGKWVVHNPKDCNNASSGTRQSPQGSPQERANLAAFDTNDDSEDED